VFYALVKRWRKIRPAFALEETTFVDIGAGMGRALLLASEMPFRKVVGVEMHPALARIARRNLAAWKKVGRVRCGGVRIVKGDAGEFKFPKGPCAAFLFNPFGAAGMRRFLRHVRESFHDRPGEVDLLYVNNEQEHVLQTQRGFTCFFQGPVNRSKSDAKADNAIMANQPDGEYAAAKHEDCSIWRWQGEKREQRD
jgi:SAM-dependent methyltransferase